MPSPCSSMAGVILGLLLLACSSIVSSSENGLTVRDVAADLACPCQCPLILQDCNMSCGLEWKEEVGQLIAQGKTKQEITEYFIAKYGEAARLTPLQKIYGKIYQYTRGFGTGEWVILWAAVAVWMALMFLIVHIVVRKLLVRNRAR